MKIATIVAHILAIATLIAFVALSLVATPAQAGELPPRPETPTPVPTEPPPPSEVEGAYILLLPVDRQAFPEEAWTVVQWQTAGGQWADVEGWQGHFNYWGEVIWWVAPDNFGEGPFRWQVFDGEARTELLATSESFELPTYSGSIVRVEIGETDVSP